MGTHYHIKNNTKTRKNQKVVGDQSNDLEAKRYLKTKNKKLWKNLNLFYLIVPVLDKIFRWNTTLEIFAQVVSSILIKPQHQIDKKVLRQDKNFSTGLPCANKKVNEIRFCMVNTK